MHFPRGVTVYGPAIEKVTSPDMPQFRADCWSVARNLKAKVENCDPDPFKSYDAQILVWPDTSIVVVLNKVVPILAFCELFEPLTSVLKFIDHGKAAAEFLDMKAYEVWSKDQLELLVTDEMFEDLIPSEQRHVKYWRKCHRPMRVGDVVFNYWD